MPPFETMDRNQDAVYWPAEGVDNYGEPVRGDAEAVKVRWVWTKRSVRNEKGDLVSIDAQLVVAQDVSVGDFYWLGSLDDFDASATDNEIMTVVNVRRTPDLKNRNIRREVDVARFKAALPEES